LFINLLTVQVLFTCMWNFMGTTMDIIDYSVLISRLELRVQLSAGSSHT